MKLFEKRATMPHPIEDVFALTVDLENAPHWHNFFTNVEQLTPKPIGIGSRWKIDCGIGKFTLEIMEFLPPHHVVFKGSKVAGIVPNFTIELKTVTGGTQIHYLLHPDAPALLQPMMALVGPPYGHRDLSRYFHELDAMLARH